MQLLTKAIGYIVMGIEDSSSLNILTKDYYGASSIYDVFYSLGLASNSARRGDTEGRDIA